VTVRGGGISQVLLLRLECTLSYSMARKNQNQGMTVFPAQRKAGDEDANEQLAYKLTAEPSPRFIDYFVIIGVPPSECTCCIIPLLFDRFLITQLQNLATLSRARSHP